MKNCKHGLPGNLCIICSSTWQDIPASEGDIDWRVNKDEWENLRKRMVEADANMDNILAHECQHGSDLRVCFACVARDIEIKLSPPSGAWMEHIGALTYIVLDDIARAAWYTKTGAGI